MSTPGTFSRRDFMRFSGLGGGVVVLGAAGCSSSGGPSSSGSGSGGSGKSSFKGTSAITLLKEISAGAPFLIADSLGLYRERGLTINQLDVPGGTDTIRELTTGGSAFGMPNVLSLVVAFQKQAPELRIVSGLSNQATVVFIAPADSPVSSIKDLSGRSVAVAAPATLTEFFAREQTANIPNVKIVNIGGPADAWNAAIQRLTDVAWSIPPLSTKLINSGKARLVWSTSDFEKQWVDNVIITTKDIIDHDEAAVRAYVEATGKACDLINNDPERAAGIWAKTIDLDTKIALQALNDGTFGTGLDMGGIRRNGEVAVKLGNIGKLPNFEQLVDHRFVR